MVKTKSVSNATQIDRTAFHIPRLEDPGFVVEEWPQLASLFAASARFESYGFELLNENALRLSKENAAIYFANASSETSDIDTLLRACADQQSILAVCGSEEQLNQISSSLNESELLQHIVLPAPAHSIDFQVQSLVRARKQHLRSDLDKKEAQETLQNIKHVLSISRELNGIRNVNKLLDLILAKARSVTRADAGSIYVVETNSATKENQIAFKVCQNDSVKLDLAEFKLPINDKSIVGKAVINAKAINISNLYESTSETLNNKQEGEKRDKSFDTRIGYPSHSMLTIPIFDISHAVIGVIQLINCKKGNGPLNNADDFAERVQAFDETAIEYAQIVAHQAGIALENAVLTEEKEALFRGFVDASVKAIEQRDPTTSGHSHRVAKLTLKLAEQIDRSDIARFRDLKFNEHQMKEIEYASLLHDFGKLGVREQVLLKSTKLHDWQLANLNERFEHIRSRREISYYRSLVNLMEQPLQMGISKDSLRDALEHDLRQLDQLFEFILKVNEPSVLPQGEFERLKDIAALNFEDSHARQRPYLHADEVKSLSITRGSLTAEEFGEIQSHVVHTYEFLRKIPWGKNLSNVPIIAGKHHEKMDGSGYPNNCTADEVPIQSRMMTISDIYDALTAADRPYKKSVPIEKALDIIYSDVKSGKCDPDLFDIFVKAEVYKIVI